MRITGLLLVGALAPQLFSQDQAAGGFTLQPLLYPGATFLAASATLSGGEIVVFDGWTVSVYFDDGSIQRELTSFQQFVFPSFVHIDPTESYALVGESSNGHVMQVSLTATSAPEPLAILPFNYDAAFESSTHALVSAATCGFGCGNEIWRVDLFSGALELVVEVDGASGPLALDPAGNLYYGTSPSQFPPPPKPTRVLRWSAAELAQHLVLGEADADVVGVGFAGAARMAIDPLGGDVFLMENNFGTGENTIREVFAGPDSTPLVAGRPFFALGNLEFVAGDGRAAFAPYQPPTGGVLRYTTTDFSTTVERFELVTRRPSLTITGPGTTGPGNFEVALEHGKPGGFALLLICPSALVHSPERVIQRFAVPLFIALDPGTIAAASGYLPVDAAGSVRQTYLNPGGYEGLFAVQALLIGTSPRFTGTSNVAFL